MTGSTWRVEGVFWWLDVVDQTELATVAAALAAGESVILPTDTVYGLCALPGVEGAVGRVFELKRRRQNAPMAVLCADAAQAFDLATGVRQSLRGVARACWPGPITFVLNRRVGLDWDLGEPHATIGVRVPDHDLVRDLAARLGPIAATSANLHGEEPGTTLEAIRSQLGSLPAIDGGELGHMASTVVDATDATWTMLREGEVSATALRSLGATIED